jgi:thiopurine S-methyltransferase
MDREFWLDRWQKNLIGFHREEVNPHVLAFWPTLGLGPGSRILVPLCGKSRDMIWLAAQGHRVLGVELSPVAVRDFFAENALSPVVDRVGEFERWSAGEIVLLCGDYFHLATENLADVSGIYDRAALVALPMHMRARYASHLQTLLPAPLPMLLVTMEYPQAEMSGPPFSVGEDEVRALYGARYEIDRLLDEDILAAEARMRERGLTQLREKVFRLRRRSR